MKIIAEKIFPRENVWNGKTFTSYTAAFQGKYYSLKGHQAAKVVEGQPLEGEVEEYKYDSKKTGQKETGYNFFIYSPIEVELSKRIDLLEKKFNGEPVLEENEVADEVIDDIPF